MIYNDTSHGKKKYLHIIIMMYYSQNRNHFKYLNVQELEHSQNFGV